MKKTIALAPLLACCLLGCSDDPGDTGVDMTTAQMEQKIKENANNPNLPPQARAAMASTGRYAGPNEYAKTQSKTAPKGK